MSNTAWKRLLLVSVLGLSTAATVAGLAIVLSRSQSRSQAQLRIAVRQRAGLTADLINAMLTGPGASAGSQPLPRPLIASNPTARRALVTGRPQLSNLRPASGGRPAGFLEARPAASRHRVSVTLVPLGAVEATLQRYLASVANFAAHPGDASAYLVDDHASVVAAGSGRVTPGQPLPDLPLRAALAGRTGSGGYGASRFFTAAPLADAPWHVVYTVPVGYLYTSRGYQWGLSFVLLACFAAIAAICLVLLIRLLSRTVQLRRANQALADRNSKLQTATEAKSRFVANLSHELRNPLNAVIGFAELMHTGRAGSLGERQREHLGIIRGSARHLLTLIEDALDLARIEAGHVRLEPEAVEPAVVAADCVNSLATLCAGKAIEVELDPRPVGEVMVDPDRLRQLITNYLSNAIKFTPAGGRVTLVTRSERGRLLVEVSDSGPGVAPADRERIFQEFVQVEGRDRSGSGLGLAVTKLIVEAQGGEVGVHSIPGHGSTFSAWLPAPPAKVSASPRRPRLRASRPTSAGSRASGSELPTAKPAARPATVQSATAQSATDLNAG
jgi:signal transduction histidine kinase